MGMEVSFFTMPMRLTKGHYVASSKGQDLFSKSQIVAKILIIKQISLDNKDKINHSISN